MLLFLLLCTGICGVITFEIFQNFFFLDRGVGGVYRIQTFLDFYIFFIFARPLRYKQQTVNQIMAMSRTVPSESTMKHCAQSFSALSKCQGSPVSLITYIFE